MADLSDSLQKNFGLSVRSLVSLKLPEENFLVAFGSIAYVVADFSDSLQKNFGLSLRLLASLMSLKDTRVDLSAAFGSIA